MTAGNDLSSSVLLDEIGTHIEGWTQLADIEESPIGGNVVKAAQYRGTVAGLKMAEQIIIEHTSNAARQPEPATGDRLDADVGRGEPT